jgi:hypothetical protein
MRAITCWHYENARQGDVRISHPSDIFSGRLKKQTCCAFSPDDRLEREMDIVKSKHVNFQMI